MRAYTGRAQKKAGVLYIPNAVLCVTNSRTWDAYAILMKWDETTDNHRNYVLAALSQSLSGNSAHIIY